MLYQVAIQLSTGRGTIAMRPDLKGPAILTEVEAHGYAEMLRDDPDVVSTVVLPLESLEERAAAARAFVEATAVEVNARLRAVVEKIRAEGAVA